MKAIIEAFNEKSMINYFYQNSSKIIYYIFANIKLIRV